MLKIVSIAVAATLLTAAHASAAEPVQVPQVQVQHDDLDLTTPQGTRALERRVDQAVDEACPDLRGRRVAKFEQDRRECRRIARASAEEQVAALLRAQRVQVADAGRASGD